jgi:cytochrome c
MLLAGVALAPMQVPAADDVSAKAGCSMCHAQDKKLFGPSWVEIATRYKSDGKAPGLLADRVRQGSKGIWGPAPMQPVPAAKISDDDLAALIAWILRQ